MKVTYGVLVGFVAWMTCVQPSVAVGQDALMQAKQANATEEMAVRNLGIAFINAIADGDAETALGCCDGSMVEDVHELLQSCAKSSERRETFRSVMLDEMKTARMIVQGDSAWITEVDGDPERIARKVNGVWKLTEEDAPLVIELPPVLSEPMAMKERLEVKKTCRAFIDAVIAQDRELAKRYCAPELYDVLNEALAACKRQADGGDAWRTQMLAQFEMGTITIRGNLAYITLPDEPDDPELIARKVNGVWLMTED